MPPKGLKRAISADFSKHDVTSNTSLTSPPPVHRDTSGDQVPKGSITCDELAALTQTRPEAIEAEPETQGIPKVKQERSVRQRGRNWTDREIRLLVQAGLAINMDARSGSDNSFA